MRRLLNHSVFLCFVSLANPCVLFPQSSGQSVGFRVVDKAGKPVEDAVVVATPASGNPPRAIPGSAVVDQEFKDHVVVVPTGTAVSFPNHDEIRHHVYSFSPAKIFEIPLYKEMPESPVVFDEEGAVALGCNIHDWMSGYIFVVDTPYFGRTSAEGLATIDLPPAEYEMSVWHPRLRGSVESTRQSVKVEGAADTLVVAMQLELKKVWKPRRGPSRAGRGGYP